MAQYVDKRAKLLYYIDNNFYYYFLKILTFASFTRRNGDQKTKR